MRPSTNCEEHQSNTRHIKEKYHLYAHTLKQAILLRYPMIKVNCKPITTTAADFQKLIPIDRKKPDPHALIIDYHRPELRIGAFEVQLCARSQTGLRQEVLHSKLATRLWPNINSILEKIGSEKAIHS
jgi:hypothetical protein